ncbi:MAG: NTPase [Candidatus Caldarchaeum sp.]
MTISRVAALTGRPGVGKTTALVRVVELLVKDGYKPGGFYTREVRQGGVRTGFEIVDLTSGARAELASVGRVEGPHVGRYAVNLDSIRSVAVAGVKKALAEADAVFVDEVGPMELLSREFVDVVREVLRSGRPALFTLHISARHSVVQEVRNHAGQYLYVLDVRNRDAVPHTVYGVMLGWLKS